MQTVSGDFTTAAEAKIRKPKVKVRITWSDPFVDPDTVASSSDANNVSVMSHTADLKTATPHKYLLLDGRAMADGSYYPFPSAVADQAEHQVGWYNDALCDGSGVFSAPYPTMTITFPQRPVFLAYVYGEPTLSEYPRDFTIQFYNGVTLLTTLNITDNDQLEFYYPVSLPAVTSMVLMVSKWSAVSTTLKIVEFYTSIVREYTGEDITSLRVLEERELRYGGIPTGGISCNEIDLSLQNIKIVE